MPPFSLVTGPVESGSYTPETILRRAKIAEALLAGRDKPITHWTQGLDEMLKGFVGGAEMNQLESAEKGMKEADKAALYGALGIPVPAAAPAGERGIDKITKALTGWGGAPAATPPAPPAAPTVDASYPGGSYAARTVGAESGGNPMARNPRSSAEGAGQFIDSTWLDILKRSRPELVAGKSDPEILALRRDPALSGEMVNAYGNENAAALTAAGLPVTDGTKYLAHFAGPAGAKAILSADPNTPVAAVLGQRVVAANPFLAGMTAGQLQAWADRKMGMGAPQAAPGRLPAAPPSQGAPAAPAVPAAPAAPAMGISDDKRAQIAKLLAARPGSPAYRLGESIVATELNAKPTDEMREYDLYRRQGGKESFFDYKTGLKKAGATNVTVDQKQEGEYEKATGKQFAELNAQIPKDAIAARGKLATLDRMNTLLSDPKITTGAGANTILELKRIAKQAGFDVGDVGGAEAVRAIGNQFALELRNPSGGAGMPGALSDKDREFLQASIPGLQQNPEGNKLIIDYLKRVAQRSLDVERLRQSYVKTNKRLDEGFYAQLSDFADKNPLFPEAETAKAASAASSAPSPADLEAEMRRRGLLK